MSTGAVPVKAAWMMAVLPAQMVALPLTVATAATGVLTVKVAAAVAGDPHEFVKTARYWFPFCPAVAVKLRVVEIAPGMLLKVAPAFVLPCHCTVGAGVPLAAAVNVAVWVAKTVRLAGFAVTAGATLTVRRAALEGAVPAPVVNTPPHWFPGSPPAALKLPGV